jgi:hypothetical protein
VIAVREKSFIKTPLIETNSNGGPTGDYSEQIYGFVNPIVREKMLDFG